MHNKILAALAMAGVFQFSAPLWAEVPGFQYVHIKEAAGTYVEAGGEDSLRIRGNCEVTLFEGGIFIKLTDSEMQKNFRGVSQFSLKLTNHEYVKSGLAISGQDKNRVLEAQILRSNDPQIKYNNVNKSPTTQFCGKFLPKNLAGNGMHFVHGTSILETLSIDESIGVVAISQEGQCNWTRRRVTLACEVPASARSLLADFLDGQASLQNK